MVKPGYKEHEDATTNKEQTIYIRFQYFLNRIDLYVFCQMTINNEQELYKSHIVRIMIMNGGVVTLYKKCCL